MSTELTNLLPAQRQRKSRMRYFARLAVVALLLLTALVLVHGVLLIPTYLYSANQTTQARAQLAGLAGLAESQEETQVRARSDALAKAVGRLNEERSVPVASAVLRAVLAVPHAGISVTGITVSAPEGNTAASMRVSGTAASRDALRSYTAALGGLPFVETADLPISAYARERDIPFTITLTGSLVP